MQQNVFNLSIPAAFTHMVFAPECDKGKDCRIPAHWKLWSMERTNQPTKADEIKPAVARITAMNELWHGYSQADEKRGSKNVNVARQPEFTDDGSFEAAD